MEHARYVTPDDDLGAVLEAVEDGETLYLSGGYHTIDAPLRNDVNYVTIQGAGINNTTIRQSGDFPILELIGTQRRGDRRTRWMVRNLTLNAKDGTTSDIVRARYGGQHRFENVQFNASTSSGNSVYAEECWDVRFMDCEFERDGDPDEGTAAVYLYNGDYDMSNSIRFTNCTWRSVTSHALYSDSSGKGKVNDRMYLVNCKFLGFGRGGRIEEDPENYYIDGVWKWMKIVNSHFNWSMKGFIRNRKGGEALQVSNCSFQQYGDTAIDAASDNNLISNCIFESQRGGSTAVEARGRRTTIIGNRIADRDGIHVDGTSTSIQGNTVTDPDRTGITLEADDCVVTGNTVISPGHHGIAVTGDSTVISSNTCFEPAKTGVRFEDARHCIATDNLVRSAGRRGIESVGESDYLLVDSNVDVASSDTDISLVGDNNEVGLHLSH
jgi:parallel beta-helix repeat protein